MDVSDDDEDDDDDTAVDSPRAIKLSPLAAAAAQGQPATVQRLLASGAAIDAMDSLGETALCKAVFGHNEESRTDRSDSGAMHHRDTGVVSSRVHWTHPNAHV